MIPAAQPVPDGRAPSGNPAPSPFVDVWLIGGVMVAAWWLAWPLGDFPVNDDWSYGIAVQRLLAEGRFRPTGWTAMPLLSQALWGAAFCLPLGFSWHTLRLSTMVLALVGVLGCHRLLLRAGGDRLVAAVGALALGLNPVFFLLSCTFMTDVPFTAFGIGAILAFAVALTAPEPVRRRAMAAGSLLALAATLCRQIGLFIPLAFALVALGKRTVPSDPTSGWPRAKQAAGRLVAAGLPLLLCIVALWGFGAWMRRAGGLPDLYDRHNAHLLAIWSQQPGLAVKSAVFRTVVALLYLGWFLWPLLLPTSRCLSGTRRWSACHRRVPLAAGVGFLVIAGIYVMQEGPMPLGMYILVPHGIGPLCFGSAFDGQRSLQLPPLPGWFWWLATGMSLVGGALLAGILSRTGMVLIRRWRSRGLDGKDLLRSFFLLATVVYLLPLIVGGANFFDRYLLPVMPPLLALLATFHQGGRSSAPTAGRAVRPSEERARGRSGGQERRAAARWMIGGLGLACLAVYAVWGTNDYFAWNRVRWSGLADLMARHGLTPREVDGGFEFNGLHRYDPAFLPRNGRSWWASASDTFMLSFTPVPGCQVAERWSFSRWPLPDGEILVLRRAEP